MKNKRSILAFVFLLATVGAGSIFGLEVPVSIGAATTGNTTSITKQDLKVAFIGDQGVSANAVAVLRLIKNEGADIVIHQGDLGYDEADPRSVIDWDNQINAVLGRDFPYFASIGNHDLPPRWTAYQKQLQERLNRIDGAYCEGDLGVKSECYYEGLHILLVGPGTMGSKHDVYIRERLADDKSLWSICSWHKVQRKMQTGTKGDEAGWKVYEECRKGGGIVVTGHEHSYARTHLINDFDARDGPRVASTASLLTISKGETVGILSGLGGMSIRTQSRPSDPWWASIYTAKQGATYGALFCTFNVNGRPDRAECYFKDIAGKVPDRFTLESAVETISGNVPPSINAGSDKSVNLSESDTVSLVGTVTDDGLPGGALTAEWIKERGPGKVEFSNSSGTNTGASFSIIGKYILRLTATDGELSNFDDLEVAVQAFSPPRFTAVRVFSSSDDAEECGSNSALYLTSSDLELTEDAATCDGDNQLVGMRFQNVAIPPGAEVVNASIQFTVDEMDSGPTDLTFFGESTDEGTAFTGTTGNISGRAKTVASVAWDNVPTWDTVGEAGPDQKTPDLTAIIQEIVNRPGWASGNSLNIIVTGSGARTAASYDGSPAQAPLLEVDWDITGDVTGPSMPGNLTATPTGRIIELSWTAASDPEIGISAYRVYRDTASGGIKTLLAEIGGTQLAFNDKSASPNTTLYYDVSAVNGAGIEGARSTEVSALTENFTVVRVFGSGDDAEECVSNSALYLTSSDLELTKDAATCDGDNQLIGMRFQNVAIPPGAKVVNASIQFTVDEIDSGPTDLTFFGESTDDGTAFTATTGNISGRAKTVASVAWDNVPRWDRSGEAGPDQKTPDLTAIIQEIVNGTGWASGNSLNIIVTGSGARTAESYDGSPSQAPLLEVDWDIP